MPGNGKNSERVAHNSLSLALALVALPCAIAVWFRAVASTVPEPYLVWP
jgi:hypothetical protein